MDIKISQSLFEEAEIVAEQKYWKLPAPNLFERAYMINNYDRRINHFRKSIYLGLLLLAIYGIANFFNLLHGATQAAIIRYVILIPLAIVAVRIFDKPRFVFWQDWLITGAGLLICIVVFNTRYIAYQDGQFFYYYGYLIVICYINIVIQPRFLPSIISSVMVCFGAITFYYYLEVEKGQFLFIAFDTVFFIFLSLLSNYYIQLQLRKTYARTLLQKRAMEQERRAKKELKKMASLDPLTGVYNRRALNRLKTQTKLTQMGFIFIDIDYFKKYNDRYGHTHGDECIKVVAELIQETIKDDDYCVRYGGEEFLVLMFDCNQDAMESVARTIQAKMQEKKLLHDGSPFKHITLSLGLHYVQEVNQLDDEINKADKGLYEAKKLGRNRINWYSS